MSAPYAYRTPAEQQEDREYLEYLKQNGRYSIEEYFYELQLTNKLGIRDMDDLNKAEREITQRRVADLQLHPVEGNYDFDHLKNVHKAIFQDVYYFAGETRTVDMQLDSITKFTKANKIESEAQRIFKKLQDKNCLQGLDKPRFVEDLADFMTDLNMLHPFREGNGRSKRAFTEQLAKYVGYEINWGAADKQAWIAADATAFDTSSDNTQTRDTSYLKILLSNAVTPLRAETAAAAPSPALAAMRAGYRPKVNTTDLVACAEDKEVKE